MSEAEHLIEDLENLRHMLGVRSDKARKHWCYRNHFNSNPGCDHYASMQRLVARGFAVEHRKDYFSATLHGCMAIGLTAKETHKALNGD
jgi:hypothetical protein